MEAEAVLRAWRGVDLGTVVEVVERMVRKRGGGGAGWARW